MSTRLPHAIKASALTLAAALVLSLAACSTSVDAGAPLRVPTGHRKPPKHSHVFVIVMENRAQTEIVGSSNAPYFNKLTRRYARTQQMFAIRHPSLPNYLALISGDTHGIDSDCTSCHVSATNLADQLEQGGFTWKGYMEDMPKPCYLGAGTKGYAKKHNPFLYFDDIRQNQSRCRRVVPYPQLSTDIFARKVPAFSWITPNLCNDTHDCSVQTGDRFLAHLVPALLKEVGPHGFVIVTWDEGTSDNGCCGGLAGGGRIATALAGPDVARGAAPARQYTQYSLLRTIEDAFGLPALGSAGDSSTVPLDAAFKRPPRVARSAR